MYIRKKEDGREMKKARKNKIKNKYLEFSFEDMD